MPFGMTPRNLDQCVQVTGDKPWPVEVEMPVTGERVWVELVDQDRFEGLAHGWTQVRFAVRDGRKVYEPRWDSITRIVFLDRPRG